MDLDNSRRWRHGFGSRTVGEELCSAAVILVQMQRRPSALSALEYVVIRLCAKSREADQRLS